MKLHLVGHGRHARDIAWTLDDLNTTTPSHIEIVGHWVDEPGEDAEVGDLEHLAARIRSGNLEHDERVLLAFMNHRERARVVARLGPTCPFAQIVHPTVVVDRSVQLGVGTLVQAGSILSPDVRLGDHVLVNLRVTVGHGALIEDYASLSPGAIVLGEATIGCGATVGPGAMVLNGVRVGEGALVGAGALVNRDVSKDDFVLGSPAVPAKIPPFMREASLQ